MGWLFMTYSVIHARSGLTAIAAVLALSSTPLAAQDATETPPSPAETTASPAPETAPEPVASEPVAAEPAAAETTAAEPAETATPAPTTTRRAAARSQTTATTPRRAASAPASNAAPVAPTPMTEASTDAMPVPPPTGAAMDPGPMPAQEPVAEASAMPSDETLSIVGAAGLGLFALGGIGMAIGRRRKRKEENEHMAANRAYLDTHPQPVADKPTSNAPSFARMSAPAMASAAPGPMLRDAPRTKLPEGFDLSRFGPHVRAAYQGPTEDNPSLSMKHRLRRAAAMDQQLRQNGEAMRETDQRPAVQRPAAQTKPAMRPLWDANGDSFMLRRAGAARTSKPAFQH